MLTKLSIEDNVEVFLETFEWVALLLSGEEQRAYYPLPSATAAD